MDEAPLEIEIIEGSGKPEWAIALGLGTREESMARPLSTKLVMWTLRTIVLAALFIAGFAVLGNVGAIEIVLSVLMSVVSVAALAASVRFIPNTETLPDWR